MPIRCAWIVVAPVLLILVAGCDQAEPASGATVAPLTATPVPPTHAPASPTATNASAPDVISVDTAGQVERLVTLSGHSDRVTGLAFSGDGAYVASSSWDDTIRLWEVPGGPEVATFRASDVDLNGIDFSPDGSLLASGEAIWEVDTQQVVHVLERSIQTGAVAFSPDGSTLAVASVALPVRLWDVASGQVVRTLEGQAGDVAFSIVFSPDGGLLAAGMHGGRVRLWEAASGHLAGTLEYGNDHDVHDVAFSPDGRLLASAGTDYAVRLWDVATGQVVHTLGTWDGLYGVAFSPDGAIVASAGCDRTVKLWEVASGQLVRSLRHADEVMAVAFSPDGTLLASGGYDNQIYLWGIPGSEDTAASPAPPPTNPLADEASPAATEEPRSPLSFEKSE
jgi:WD40 repeat protein